LPKGTWYDFYTNKQLTVKDSGVYPYPLESGNFIFVFAKGGTILPLKEKVRMSAILARNEPYVLNVYLETNDDKKKSQYANGYLYLDDGETFNFEKKKEFQLVRFQYEK